VLHVGKVESGLDVHSEQPENPLYVPRVACVGLPPCHPAVEAWQARGPRLKQQPRSPPRNPLGAFCIEPLLPVKDFTLEAATLETMAGPDE